MWRLSETENSDVDDQGVATIFVILAMTAMLAGAALAIDVGGYVAALRSAQNSADATVLALATDCALDAAPIGGYENYYSAYYKFDDGQTINTEGCRPGNEATVMVTKPFDSLLIARDASRRAVAAWGSLGGATTAPVVISECSFDLATANGTTYPSAEVIIPLGSGGPACPGRPPGAFGWLDTGLDGPCSIATTLDENGQLVVHGNTGNGNVNPWNCITAVGVNGLLTIPIYAGSCRDHSPCVAGQDDGRGNNNYYLILGYAVIEVTGWDLQHGSPRTGGAPAPGCPPPGSTSCIRGRFVNFVTQLGSTGNGGDFGVSKISLID